MPSDTPESPCSGKAAPGARGPFIWLISIGLCVMNGLPFGTWLWWTGWLPGICRVGRSGGFDVGDFGPSSNLVARRMSLLSLSAATAAASDCLPMNRRWCTKRVTIESMRLASEDVISLLSNSASPSKSAPETGPTEPLLLRSAPRRSASSEFIGGFGVGPCCCLCCGECWLD